MLHFVLELGYTGVMAEYETLRSAKDRIIFTTLLRHELSERLGFSEEHGAGSSRDRLAFLKTVDWDEPRNMDKAFETYVRWMVNAIKDMHENDPQYDKLRVSWGSPHTDEKGKILRPQLRIMVRNEEQENESYLLSFTPPAQENTMTPSTRDVLQQLRALLHDDLGIDTPAIKPHDIIDVKGKF